MDQDSKNDPTRNAGPDGENEVVEETETVTETVTSDEAAGDTAEPVVPTGDFENQTEIEPVTVPQAGAGAQQPMQGDAASGTADASTQQPVQGAPAAQAQTAQAPQAAPMQGGQDGQRYAQPMQGGQPAGAPGMTPPNATGRKGRGNFQGGQRSVTVAGQEFDYGALITIIGAIVGLIGIFVPFIQATLTTGGTSIFGYSTGGTTQSASASLMTLETGIAWVILIGLVAVSVLSVIKQNVSALTVTIMLDFLMIYTVAELGAKYMLSGSSTGSSTSSSLTGYTYTYSFSAGAWLIIIAAILLLIGTIVAEYNEVQSKKAPAAPVNPNQVGFQYNAAMYTNAPQPATTPVTPQQYADNIGFQYSNGQYLPNDYAPEAAATERREERIEGYAPQPVQQGTAAQQPQQAAGQGYVQNTGAYAQPAAQQQPAAQPVAEEEVTAEAIVVEPTNPEQPQYAATDPDAPANRPSSDGSEEHE
ncbi:DUF4064 domain-containing protein [Bifidobacterium choloepi]|uniref:Uncharacterized protein n=1 Tax=Bifidobacterium choloepi TaxID=2614131 RepID=A0A6I5MZE6_9BIFI|nr:DUF4064 domain-containing protein [Bifidobacterium choloepi]NEG69586.1 hypothetical protein [Bifidobacterium choloepi]